MKNWKILLLSFLCVFLLSGNSFALLTNPNRPIDLQKNASEIDLQAVLDSIHSGGPAIDAEADQVKNAIFKPASGSAAIASFIVEIAGYASSNQFGIYEFGNTANKALIFDGANTPGNKANVEFFNDGTVTVTDLVNLTQNTYNLDGSAFGFYIDVYANGNTLQNTFYSEDDQNGGAAQAVIYQGNNTTQLTLPGNGIPAPFADTEWIVAFEDQVFANGDKDFQDLVVMVSNIVAVPEPSTMIISSLFLIGAGFYVRRKLHNKS